MAVCQTLLCPTCGTYRKPERFGLTETGQFDPQIALPNELCLRTDTIGGRGKLTVVRSAVPPQIALGIREMLKHRLAQVEGELLAGGVELPDDD